jgi:hypothetical protein
MSGSKVEFSGFSYCRQKWGISSQVGDISDKMQTKQNQGISISESGILTQSSAG